ncbi:MAG: hypothetical protein F7C35_01010 [Desulfurococcales archaeon]|nr:hypothetical protein [Desulfurococcales archaeon]
MVQRQQTYKPDLEKVKRVREKVLKAYNEIAKDLMMDTDIPVVTALSDEDLEELILLALAEAKAPVSWKEIKLIFQGIAGEDRLRKILSKLKATNTIAELTKTRYALPEYVPLNELNKVKNPGIISKILKIKQTNIQ